MLHGSAELTSRDPSATITFLHITRRFQGPFLPPSNAVYASLDELTESLPLHHHPARKGVTTFSFRLPLPSSSPSSISLGKEVARLQYRVVASVDVYWKGERNLVTDTRNLDVIEAYDEFTVESGRHLAIGENGKLWAQGVVINRVLVQGQPACVELFVKNYTAVKVSAFVRRVSLDSLHGLQSTSLSLSLTRNLQLSSSSTTESRQLPRDLEISDVLLTVPFKGPEYVVHPDTEGVANLVFDVPEDAKSVHGGIRDGGDECDHTSRYHDSLFSVNCFIRIKIGMSSGARDLEVCLPVSLVHASAFDQCPTQHPAVLVSPQQWMSLPPDPFTVSSPPPMQWTDYSERSMQNPWTQHQARLSSVSPQQQLHAIDFTRRVMTPFLASPTAFTGGHAILTPSIPMFQPPSRAPSAHPYTSHTLPQLPVRIGDTRLEAPFSLASVTEDTANVYREEGKGVREKKMRVRSKWER